MVKLLLLLFLKAFSRQVAHANPTKEKTRWSKTFLEAFNNETLNAATINL